MDNFNELSTSMSTDTTRTVLSNGSSANYIKRDDFDKLLTHLDDMALSDKEKDQFFSIVQDRYISSEEIESLSYEEAKKIKNLIIEYDENGKAYDASLINASYKASSMMASSLVSSDETFNKAFFEKIRTMDDQKEIIGLVAALTGTYHMENIAAREELINDANFDFHPIKETDMKAFLENKIDEFKDVLQSPDSEGEKRVYETLLSWYSDIYDNYKLFEEKDNTNLENIMRNNRPNPIELFK